MKFAAALCMVSLVGSVWGAFVEDFENGPTGFNNSLIKTWGNAGPTAMAFASGNWVAWNLSSPLGPTGWYNGPVLFAPHGGTSMLNADQDSATLGAPINNWIMSPQSKFTNASVIKFWTRTVTNPLFPVRLLVKLSQSAGSTNPADFTTNLLTINPALTTTGYPSGWTQFTISITGLSAAISSGRFAFVFQGVGGFGNADLIGIDDVQLL